MMKKERMLLHYERRANAVALLLLPLLASAQRALLCALNEKTPAARRRQGDVVLLN